MPRWSSFALMAATALVAAPVGTHYISQNKPVESRAADSPRSTAVLAQTDVTPSGSSKSTKSEKLTPEDGAVEEAEIDLARTVCAFMALPVQRASHGCLPGSPAGMDVMLAILPDPVHTQMALRFDRGVDSIEDELGQLGWVYDRSWLPWDNVARKASDRSQDRRANDRLQHALETLPGVLLFRKGGSEEARRRLIVLVVGDTPTRGVNVEQFTRTLKLWEDPCGLVHTTCAGAHPVNLAIFGPTFSGSLPSLHDLLFQSLAERFCNAKQPLTVTISSGTVSDSRLMEDNPFTSCPAVTLRQESFAVDAGYLAEHLAEFEPHSRLIRNHIANLSERETAFGSRDVSSFAQTRLSSYIAFRKTLDCTIDKVICASVDDSISRLQRGISTPANHETAGGTPVTNLTFPRGISRLRRAYEENGIVGFSQSLNASHTQLQFSSVSDDRKDDTIPSFAGNLYTLSMEADMASVANTLVSERYSVVLLSASDVMDEIFVARYLAQHAPDLTVVINDADELFLREGQDMSLQNIYMVSPWPLIERNIFWSSLVPADAHVFPSRSDQGTAVAVHHLLCTSILDQHQRACQPETYREYRPPFLVDGASNDNKLEPPLWLSVIGHGRFLPVSMLDLDDTHQQLPELSELSLPRVQDVAHDSVGKELPAPFTGVPIAEYTSLAVKLVAILIVGLLLWHGAACLHCRLDRPFAWTYARTERQHDVIRLVVKAALSILGLLALAMLYIPNQKLPLGSSFVLQSKGFHLFLTAGEILAAAISSLSIWTAIQVQMAKRKKDRERIAASISASIYFSLIVLIMGLSHWSILHWFSPGSRFPTEKIFFLYRSSLPFSGASPVLPLLLMMTASAVWVHGIFSQLAFFGHRIPKLPDGFEHLRCPSNKSVESLTNLLSTRLSLRRIAHFAVCLVTAWLMLSLLPGNGGIQSFSHGTFDRWITAATLLFSATILQDLVTATRAWNKLHHSCLVPLKQSPLRWGFTWVKGFSWRRIWTSSKSLSSNQIFDYLTRLLETDRRDPTTANVEDCYKGLYKQYIAEPKDDRWIEGFTSGVERLHAGIRTAATERLEQLQPLWEKDAGPLTGADEIRGMHLLQKLDNVKDDPEKGPAGQSREALLKRMGSEEFVALLYVGFITVVLVQIRHRIVRAAVMYILLMWALTSYPWMYRHAILLELSALLVALSITTITIYSQMHRDDILSRTTETESGKLDSGFFQKVIPIIGVPLLSLIASQFPEFSNLIFSWIQPGLSHIQ